MKFSETLAVHLTPEWRSQYINYVSLKELIVNGIRDAPVKDDQESNEHTLELYQQKLSEKFFMACDSELMKVNTFFAEKKAESLRHFHELSNGIKRMNRDHADHPKSLGQKLCPRNRRAMLINRYKISLSELYLHMVLLQNYQVLNHTGFRKILKKYDKLMHSGGGHQWFLARVSNAAFYTDRKLDNLIETVENIFTEYLENGNKAEAMKRLRVPPLLETQQVKTVFRTGLFTGITSTLILVILIKMFVTAEYNHERAKLLWHLYRGSFYAITCLFLFSMNVYAWRHVGINHVLIFELDPRRHLTSSDILEIWSIFAVIWCLSFYTTLQYHQYLSFPLLILPLAVIIASIVYVIMPLPIFHWRSRYFFLKALGRVLTAPLQRVSFVDFWLGDQLMSLTTCLVDFKGLICYYFKNRSFDMNVPYIDCFDNDYLGNAIVSCLPPWFRLAQSLRRYRDTGAVHPFLTNGLKYLTNFPVIIFRALMVANAKEYDNVFQNPFVWGFLITNILCSIYGYAWDVLRDFNICRTLKYNVFLRGNIIYPKGFYYFVIVENFILRFTWILDFYIVTNHLMEAHNMQSITAFFEIIRRHIWNYIRLENEHLFNTGRFRAVRDISLMPLDFSRSLTDLENLMDDNSLLNYNKHPDSDKVKLN